jgi:hypothetical protein
MLWGDISVLFRAITAGFATGCRRYFCDSRNWLENWLTLESGTIFRIPKPK